MHLLFEPFIQCFVELSKLLFNYSIPLFEIPLYVFITLPLIFKILLIPVVASGSNLQNRDEGVVSYLKSRVYRKVQNNRKGGD